MFQRFAVVLAIGVLFSCNHTETTTNAHDHSEKAPSKKEAFKDVQFTSGKDLVCGMPVSAGVSDTAHYKGGVYGFCALECKEAFAADPESFLAGK
ncbi:MAG TPA: YHS domain-containing protein [Lacibacter sp.]|nr:YHS domain-containing protein [Lacibacter sp.]HMO88603.1 YHS domain-containing protein [Lacibacter sp.]HMP85967.1 YHS domain-containing protein [Lacibacter sp.]